MYTGVDIGSLVTKTAILDGNGVLVSSSIVDSRSNPGKAAGNRWRWKVLPQSQ